VSDAVGILVRQTRILPLSRGEGRGASPLT
jgi:hypothetical protein